MIHFCAKCHKPISPERIEALKILEKLFYEWDCLDCASNDKVKAIYTGISGASPLIFSDKIGNESHLSEQDEEIQKQFKIGQKDVIEEYYSDNEPHD